MSSSVLYALVGVALFCIGFYALIVHAHLLRKILAINIMSSGISLLLVAMARRGSGIASDPVPHALVLTGIVVVVSMTAFALALACRIHAETGQARLSEKESE